LSKIKGQIIFSRFFTPIHPLYSFSFPIDYIKKKHHPMSTIYQKDNQALKCPFPVFRLFLLLPYPECYLSPLSLSVLWLGTTQEPKSDPMPKCTRIIGLTIFKNSHGNKCYILLNGGQGRKGVSWGPSQIVWIFVDFHFLEMKTFH
jgi:hypothetical protein